MSIACWKATESPTLIVENIYIGVTCTPEEIQVYIALFREFRDVFAWSYEEMPDIDTSIVVHEIPMYPGAKPVRQRLRPVHPRKAAAIKAEVEKLLKARFIYPIPLTDWVSNIVPVDKKQGTIRICVDYRDINRACPKDNYPTPFIDQLIDECAGSEIYSFMDDFSVYNQINIAPADQHKMAFICPWGTFTYKKLPFGLKNAGATFQCAMSYAFHDIRHIVQPYLDDLPAHSAKRADHPSHLLEAVNKVLVTMLQRTVGMHKSSWHLMLFSTFGAYRTSVKDATGFTHFQLVYGLEATLPIECEIPSLKLAVELLPDTTPVEDQILYLERPDETRRLASLAIEAQKKRVKTHFDNTVNPRSFIEGDLVLLYDQANDKLGAGKIEPMWHGPYIVKIFLQKGAYELIDYEGNPLDRPRNGLYIKKYYA
eukprot:PITA_06970